MKYEYELVYTKHQNPAFERTGRVSSREPLSGGDHIVMFNATLEVKYKSYNPSLSAYTLYCTESI